MRTRLLLLGALSATVLLCGQEAAAPVAPTAPTAPTAPAPAVAAPVIKGKDSSDVDFPDEEIRVILRNIADLYELNLVVPDTLQGRTSLKLRDVTWRQIFQVVLSPVGYTFIEDGNIIKIVSNVSLGTEPTTTELIKLNSSSPVKLAEALKGFVDEKAGEKIQAMPDTNFIVLTATPARLAKLRETIEKVDSPGAGKAVLGESDVRQILIETKFIEVTNGNSKNIGVDWSSLSGYGVGASGIGRTYGKTSATSNGTTNGTTGSDTASNSVSIANGTPTVAISNGSTQGSTNSFTASTSGGISRVDTAIFSADAFRLVLNALQSSNNSRLISNPTLVTFNGRESTLHVGDEIPVSGGGAAAGASGTVTKSPALSKKEGIILNFTPQIVTIQPAVTANGVRPKVYEAVRLDLSKPSIKVKIEDAAGGIILRSKTSDKLVDGNLEPVFRTRSVATEVVLRDGYTMGIGGMIQTDHKKSSVSVPLLGSIPVLGRLFRTDGDTLSTTNLIVFLTAKIINPVESREQFSERLALEDEEAKKSDFVVHGSINPKWTQQMQIPREDLPGFRESAGSPFYVPPPTAKELKEIEKARKKAEKEKKDHAAADAKTEITPHQVEATIPAGTAK